MILRKNTKAFKTILEIFTACQDRPDRENLIRLFITRAGTTVADRINIEGIEEKASLFYELNYQAVLNSLRSSNHQLHESETIPGVFYFHSSSNKAWDETPFEFDEAIKAEFAALPDLPRVRKKEKVGKTSIPVASVTKPAADDPKKTGKKVIAKTEKIPVLKKGPPQPDFKLKHEIEFDHLDKIIFRQARFSKKDVLEYYDKISPYLLPYLKDRPIAIRLHSDVARTQLFSAVDALKSSHVELPDWLQSGKGSKKSVERELLCNEKEHLLFFANIGSIEFHPTLARVRSIESPDYLVITIESPGAGLAEASDIALQAKMIFLALKISACLKTDGNASLHIYIPLESGAGFDASENVAAYLCKLIRLKTKDDVTLKGSDDFTYGKVILDYSLNSDDGKIIAPYSLVQGESPIVAAPVTWTELEEGIQAEDLNADTIFTHLKKRGDPFEALSKKKVNVPELLKILEERYSFLF